MRLPSPFGPGSVPWLLVHDIRLGHRGMRASGRRSGRVSLAILGTILVLLHVAGFAAAPFVGPLRDQFRAESLMAASIALASLFALFLCKAISEAADALYERGDLDLLLSSPLPMRRVLTTRLIAIAIISGIMPILLVLPFVNGMVLHGHFEWVGVYPVLASLCIGAAAAGSAITFGLLAWLGPRWTALAARVMATLFGAVAYLVAQFRFLYPGYASSGPWLALEAQARSGGHGPLWWPARALTGDPIPMAGLILANVLAATLVSHMLGKVYASGVLGHLALPAGGGRQADVPGFGDGRSLALLRKEALLLVRHPGLASQLVYQFVFLAPGVLAVRGVGEAIGLQARAGAVLLAAMMTGRIARIIATGPFGSDESAGLAASSPAPSPDVLLAKLVAAGTLMAAVVAASLLVVGLEMPQALLATAVAATGAASTRLWLAAGRVQATRRVGMKGRFSGDPDALSGFMLNLFWGAVGVVLTFTL